MYNNFFYQIILLEWWWISIFETRPNFMISFTLFMVLYFISIYKEKNNIKKVWETMWE